MVSPQYINNRITVPQFIIDYNLTGSVQISRSFEQHPQASFSLICARENIISIRNMFNSYEKRIDLYGIPFRVNNYSETIHPLSVNPFGLYEVSVSLEGWYSELMNKSVFIKNNQIQQPDNGKFNNPECQINKPKNTSISLSSGTSSNKFVVLLTTLAGKAGFSYLGHNFACEFDLNIPADATTSFSNELQSRLRLKGLFGFYSNAAGVMTKNWKTVGLTVKSDHDIISVVQNSDNTIPIGYKPSRLEWDYSCPETSIDGEDTLGNKKPEWEYKAPKVYTVVTGKESIEPPLETAFLQTLDLNYDQSGPRRIKKETTYEGSHPLKEIETTYGYAYLAREITSGDTGILFAPAAPFWKAIEQKTTVYIYDTKTGYLLGNNVSGWKMCRFKTENTEQPETLTLDPAEDKSELRTFDFRIIPVKGLTRYVLRQFRDYYKDSSKVNPYIFYQECNSAGKMVTKYVKDPTWVEPMFVGEEETRYTCFSKMANPFNESLTFQDLAEGAVPAPPLTTGEDKVFKTNLKAFRSKNIRVDLLLSMTDSFKNIQDNVIGSDEISEDRYITEITEFSAQDPGFSTSLDITRSEESSGKPSEATRKPLPYVVKGSVDPDDGKNVIKYSVSNGLIRKTNNKNVCTAANYKYILTTTGYSPYHAEQGSVSYNTKKLDEALLASKTDIEIQDFQSNLQTSLTTFFNPYLQEGDKFYFSFSYDYFPRRILSSSSVCHIHGYDENGIPITTGETQLSLGLDSNLGNTVQLTKFPITSGTQGDEVPPDEVIIFDIHNVGKELGEITDFDKSTITRYNF